MGSSSATSPLKPPTRLALVQLSPYRTPEMVPDLASGRGDGRRLRRLAQRPFGEQVHFGLAAQPGQLDYGAFGIRTLAEDRDRGLAGFELRREPRDVVGGQVRLGVEEVATFGHDSPGEGQRDDAQHYAHPRPVASGADAQFGRGDL